MVQYLTKLEDSHEDWHLAPIQEHTQVHKLFPFYPADLANLEMHRITTVFQIFKTHQSRGINKLISPDLIPLLLVYSVLQQKLRIFMWAFLQKPSHTKHPNPCTNLVTLWNLDTDSAQDKYHLKCCKHLDTFVEVVPDFLTRIKDEIAIQPDQLTFNNACKLLQLPSLTSKTQLHFPTYNTLDLSNMSKPQKFCCSSKKLTSPDVNPQFDNHATIPVML